MAVSVEQVIEQLRTLPSNAERGAAFEKMMLRYFELDPALSQQYDKVWLWQEWPGRDGKPDTGIDLVAREADTGEYTAIQCKFYEPTHTLAKSDIDSFFTASGKAPFTNRIIISTTNHWSRHAEDALKDQYVPAQRIGQAEFADSPIRWDIAWPQPGVEMEVVLKPAIRHRARQHQKEAIDAVFRGFNAGNDRGKLIMACGTGKTFTALRIAERVAEENGGRANILFALPSISLLSQTLREWAAQAKQDLRAFAVCSDSKVSRAAEDISTCDLEIPVTTDGAKLAASMQHRRRARGLTVVFTTYQSLQAVAEAQNEHGVDRFDLVIADEAHRTTGVTLSGADESAFVKIHDETYLHADKRLYMTATPRIYSVDTQAKAADADAEITSMDDEDVYGPEFHRLSFGAAVERGLLSDYKVLVLTVDADVVAGPLQAQMADGFGELRLDDASKIIGCWNGLAKRAGDSAEGGGGFGANPAPMRKAVAFAQNIAHSQQFANLFPAVVDGHRAMLQESVDDGKAVSRTNMNLACEVRHVDGTMNALTRGDALRWLKAPTNDDECRILSNARCLSEGVDVPALDAVMFLHPRNSVVDVVQSVGRVMRKADGKDYGYIILPVAVPAGVSPDEALSNNAAFKVVWDVLGALRSHDERFNAMVNSIALNKSDIQKGKGTNQLFAAHVSSPAPAIAEAEIEGIQEEDPYAVDPAERDKQLAKQMAIFSLAEWQEAIYTRIVEKVGTRSYWEDWAKDVAGIASALTSRIHAVLDQHDPAIDAEFERFVTGLRGNLNESVSAEDAIGMLAQHLITKPVFDALFASSRFAERNPISQTMQAMVGVLGAAGLESETASLQGFYESVRRRAAEVTTAEGKQRVISDLYQKFFKIGFVKQAEALGIVYTPVQVVDFILRAANQALKSEFGQSLSDEGVHILDPFTGTGTFITRLLQSGIITGHDLARKYASELHANEIMLLAYYIAAVNIETTFHALAAKDGSGQGSSGYDGSADYTPFDGMVLTDTFQMTEAHSSFDDVFFPANNERITAQQTTPITVIVGNPPYSVGQGSANDLNANLKYPTLDGQIADTYAKLSTATNKNSLYDSYLRALRWATDRIEDRGIVAFVMNGGWIDNNTADGIRLSLVEEYSTLYVFNLRGNQRTAGEQSRKEGGKIFGSGSRNTIAIIIGVKNPAHTRPCQLRYRDIGDYLSRDEKLDILTTASLTDDEWRTLTPNSHGDWVDQRDDTFSLWPVIGEKNAAPNAVTIFQAFTRGLETARDSWVYNYSREDLQSNVQRMIDNYNEELAPFREYCQENSVTKPREATVTAYLNSAGAAASAGDYIKWSRSLRTHLAKGVHIGFGSDRLVPSMYRPFSKQHAYFDRHLNHERSQLPSMFPTPHHTNIGFYQVGSGSAVPFSVLMTDLLPNLHVTGAGSGGQFFPRWTYEKADAAAESGQLDFTATDSAEVDEWGYRKIDNITDEILASYQGNLRGGGCSLWRYQGRHFLFRLRSASRAVIPGKIRRGPEENAAAHPHPRDPATLRAACRRWPRASRPARAL